METKFTPGPWEWDDEVWTEYDPAERAPWLVDSNGNPVLSGVIHCKSEWDARLMSAAPELLEAVETLLDCFVNDPLGWMDSSDTAIEKAYDAIHKAKGE